MLLPISSNIYKYHIGYMYFITVCNTALAHLKIGEWGDNDVTQFSAQGLKRAAAVSLHTPDGLEEIKIYKW